MNTPYTIEEHQHRLSAWAASTAARASSLCRFDVELGVSILQAAGFDAGFSMLAKLPDPSKIDQVHRLWREAVIAEAKSRGRIFSHGVAAKLINVYLKARFVVAGQHEDIRVRGLHPPVDWILLDHLAKSDVGGLRSKWNKAKNKGWSKYNSDEYEEVIDLFRSVIPGQPLWTIEKYWKGHQ